MGLLPREVMAECLVLGQDRLDEPADLLGGARLALWLDRATARRASTAPSGRGGETCRPDDMYRPGEPGSPEAVKPIYVRSPDADIHITKMRDPWAGTGPEA